jgi:3-polyprenyl-4-hydroxybenzoate decarboxylase
VTAGYGFHVLVSADVPVDDRRLALWGWFTRFDPLLDLHPVRREMTGNRLILHAPIAIDATWKAGYRKPVEFDPDVEKRVDAQWSRYGIPL